MTLHNLLAWSLGAITLAYSPAAPEILLKMEAALRRVDPVQVRVVRESPEGKTVEEAILTVPGKAGSTEILQRVLDLPYVLMTLPGEELAESIPTAASEEAKVTLGRVDGKICYILEGRDERLWIGKNDLIPFKIEVLAEKRMGTRYLYLDMIQLSDEVFYPSRTEVWRGGELILVERLIPAVASSEGP